MDRGTRRAVIGTAIVVGVLVSSIPFIGLFGVLFGAMIADCALMGILFVLRSRLGVIRASPDEALAYIAHRLRAARYRVKAGPGELSVWTGRGSLVRIHIRPSGTGSEVAWSAYAASGGWGTVVTLIILAWTAIAAIPAMLYLFFRGARFVRDRLLPILPRDGAIPTTFHPDDIVVLLTAGLSEGYRLAEEAYEMEKNTYQDHQGIVVLVAILAGFLLLAWVLLSSPEPDFTVRLQNAMATATVSALGLGIGLAWLVRHHFRPRLVQYRTWSDRLSSALERETQRGTPTADVPSTFELLSSATWELPNWLGATHRAGLGASFGTWSLVFLLVWAALEVLWFSVVLALSGVGLYFAVLLFVGGVGLSLLAYKVNERWTDRQEREIGSELASWHQRLQSTWSRMEKFLQDL